MYKLTEKLMRDKEKDEINLTFFSLCNGFLTKNGLHKQWNFIYKKNKVFTRKEIKINFIS